MTRSRWWVATLLFLATVINYVDRQTLSVLAPELRARFHMSNTDYAHVIFAFLLAYMLMQSGSGRLMDLLGTRRGFSITIAWWSVAAWYSPSWQRKVTPRAHLSLKKTRSTPSSNSSPMRSAVAFRSCSRAT